VNYLGIDPGGSGGLALLAADGRVLDARATPDSDLDLYDSLVAVTLPEHVRAVVEAVGGFSGQSASASFKFGASFGAIRMALTAVGIPYELVAPTVWQRPFNLPSGKKAGSKVAKKNAHKSRAQELFPGAKVTHATADALLLAEWLRRKEERT
jgi:hypothetical protein